MGAKIKYDDLDVEKYLDDMSFFPIVWFKFSMAYLLCFYYNMKFALGVLVLFITKFHTKFWVVKERPKPPKQLYDKAYGDHRFATVNGIRLHYVEKGNKSNPLIVFVHGFPEFWYSWRHQIKEFSKDYWVVALDMRGYNDSDKPKGLSPYKMDLLADDIKELVALLGRKKFTLVAHDWGAVIAFHYINKYMDTIDRYIMMGAPSVDTMNVLFQNNWEQFRMSWYCFFFQAPYLPEFINRLYDLKAFELMQLNSKTITDDDIEVYKYAFAAPGALTPPLNYYRANLQFNTKNRIKPTTFAPGLYLLGEHDIYICKDTGPILKKFYKNLEYQVIEGANHFLQQDKYEAVNKVMREFLEKNNC